MFNFGKDLIKEVKKAMQKRIDSINKDNFEKFIPEAVKKEVSTVVKRKEKRKRKFPWLALGIGAAAAAVGIGTAKLIYDKSLKKAVILVGDGKKPSKPLTIGGFKGYALKYTTIDEFDTVLDNLALSGIEEIVIVPMTVLNGYENEKIRKIAEYKGGLFAAVSYAPALMSSDEDYDYIASTLIACTAGVADDTAVVYVGKGTTHYSNAAYIALSERLKDFGCYNVFIGTATAYPSFERVEKEIAEGRFEKVVVCPLELTLTDEFKNELCGDEESSWQYRFTELGYECSCYLKGLCAYKGIRKLIVEHTKSAM
ncbi:MAG: sirohydrochlorin cobaltochelatase [Firmicutes bacterium]|nr:sirohydrochlorin cobaltochelatase [Bacillota bacterium]